MALKAIIGALTDAAEALRGEYRPGTKEEGLEGKFVLAVEGQDGWALENVNGLKSAVSSERAAREKAEGALKAFGELKPDEVTKRLERLSELEKIDPAKEADKLAEAKAQSRIDQVTKAHAEELAKANAAASKAMAGLKTRTVQAAINDALAKANPLNPEALRLKLQSHIRLKETGNDDDPFSVEVVGADGAPLVDGQARPLSLDSFVADLRKDQAWATSFKPEGKSGSGASGAGASGAGKTMTRTAFDQLDPMARAETIKAGTTIVDG